MIKDLGKIKDEKIKKDIEKMFEHYDVAEMTDERKAWIKEKFTTAKDFEMLRIILGIIADEEAGLFIQRDEDAILESERYEFEDRIRKGVKNIIKNVIPNLYFLTKLEMQNKAVEAVIKGQEIQEEQENQINKLKEKENEIIELEKKGSGINT